MVRILHSEQQQGGLVNGLELVWAATYAHDLGGLHSSYMGPFCELLLSNISAEEILN